jgi:cytochrome c oxidase cbb3-type subunit IV
MNTIRIVMTLVSLATFIGIMSWAWSRSNRARFAEAAQLPFVDEAAQLPFVDEAAQLPFADEKRARDE